MSGESNVEMAACLAPTRGDACDSSMNKDTNQCPNCDQIQDGWYREARLKLVEGSKLAFKCCALYNCVSGPL